MRERAFNARAHEVRAILGGRQSQTRRIVDPRIHVAIGTEENWATDPSKIIEQSDPEFGSACLKYVPCPYGQPGDALYVRETWAPHADEEQTFRNYCAGLKGESGVAEPGVIRPEVFYRADGGDPFINNWRPSIHMPRWASRITLEVTGVRVERLQAITEEDARAEGAVFVDHGKGKWGRQLPGWHMDPAEAAKGWEHCLGTARFAVGNIWNELHEKDGHPWHTNPWVWVVSFRRVEAAAEVRSV